MGWTWKAKEKQAEGQETIHIVEHPQYIIRGKDVEMCVILLLNERTELTQAMQENYNVTCTF